MAVQAQEVPAHGICPALPEVATHLRDSSGSALRLSISSRCFSRSFSRSRRSLSLRPRSSLRCVSLGAGRGGVADGSVETGEGAPKKRRDTADLEETNQAG